METLKLCESDYRFMCVIWDNEPLSSRQLVGLCAQKLGWKKSTTYTMIKKLSQKGYVQNVNSTVTALIPQEQVQAFESGYVVDQSFSGSLPAFVASFISRHPLKESEIEAIQRLLARHTEGSV